jgi:hypothetical protein
MEANRKRRGFLKGKLMSFHRAAAKPSSTHVQYTSKVKPSQSSPSTASVEFLLPQDYVFAQPQKQQVSFIVPADSSQHENLIYGVAADESIDMKAANFISSVQERFKLEHYNSERKKCQDVQ